MAKKTFHLAALTTLGLLVSAATAQAQKSDKVVKITSESSKIDDDGNQTITLHLAIDKGYHLYANPPKNENFDESKVVVEVKSAAMPQLVKVMYPEGQLLKDKDLGDYRAYEDEATITAQVRRAKGDTGPLTVVIHLYACNDKSCLAGATVKVTVP